MSGDKDGLNAMLQTKIKELAEASAKAATVETLQKELDEKTKEGISLHANVKTLEAKTQDEGRELQELRAKLQKIHGEQVTTPLVRPNGI
jgi:flagellar motility protein MotE (MotC chaperone)